METENIELSIGGKKNNEAKSNALRVTLPDAVTSHALDAMNELKKRKATIKLDELLVEALSKLDKGYWERQIELHTPAEYYLELAKEHPQLLEQLIQQAKRGMQQIENGGEFRAPKKPGRKPKNLGEVNGSA